MQHTAVGCSAACNTQQWVVQLQSPACRSILEEQRSTASCRRAASLQLVLFTLASYASIIRKLSCKLWLKALVHDKTISHEARQLFDA
jgi:hypothetical protein